jgi:hypothetical protein
MGEYTPIQLKNILDNPNDGTNLIPIIHAVSNNNLKLVEHLFSLGVNTHMHGKMGFLLVELAKKIALKKPVGNSESKAMIDLVQMHINKTIKQIPPSEECLFCSKEFNTTDISPNMAYFSCGHKFHLRSDNEGCEGLVKWISLKARQTNEVYYICPICFQ